MAVILDANVCLFQERYMTAGFKGGQEVAELFIEWLSLLFLKIEFFTVYLTGDFSRLFASMDESLVGISPWTIIEFTEGFAAAVGRKVEFVRGRTDVGAMFSELTHKSTSQ